MRYLGVCAIIKDEDLFLDEWVAYYMHCGVTAFYLYDNASRIPLRQSLRKFSGLRTNVTMTVYDAPGKAMQMVTYNHCLRTNKDQCRWIAFIDCDEFIVPGHHAALPSMLEEFEPHAGLALNWKVFGSNGHKRRPTGLQIENYTKALADTVPGHTHVKSIVDPRRANFFFNPHMCTALEGAIVREDGVPITEGRSATASWKKGQINHYLYRSKEDFYAKQKKSRADIFTGRRVPERFFVPEGDVVDESAVRFAPGVKKILAAVRPDPASTASSE